MRRFFNSIKRYIRDILVQLLNKLIKENMPTDIEKIHDVLFNIFRPYIKSKSSIKFGIQNTTELNFEVELKSGEYINLCLKKVNSDRNLDIIFKGTNVDSARELGNFLDGLFTQFNSLHEISILQYF